MDETTRARYDARAEVLRALAHPTRLFLLDRLAEGERCVCELTDLVGADISTVSRHLARLRAAGIVGSEKRGNEVHYRLRMPCVLEFLGCCETVLQGRAAREAALAEPSASGAAP